MKFELPIFITFLSESCTLRVFYKCYKGVLCIIHTVEHNYIYVLVHKENNNYMFRSYLWTIFRLSINL